MRRLGMLLSVLALGLAAASLASATAMAAGTPEWFECVKNKTAGKLEKGCAKEGGKAGYEAKPGLGGAAAFTAKGASTVLRAVGGHEVTCASFAEEGERVMPNLLKNLTITFKSCFATGTTAKCYGQEEGETTKFKEVTSETLAGELGYVSHSPLKVGLKLVNQAEPGGLLIQKIYCGGSAVFHERWRGSLTGELRGAVNVSSNKATLAYVLGSYLGEVSPGYTPLTDPPLEGEEAGGLIEESQAGPGEPWAQPLPGGFASSSLKIKGTLMVGA
jgi:hypothetical protein